MIWPIVLTPARTDAHDRCQFIELDDQPGECYAVACEECGARGPMDTDADSAMMKWNMRYGHEEPKRELFD